jgi:glucosaminylphosphatidylinositol acyltransferase
MDLGVGSFVFSQGIVSAIQLIKDPAYLASPIVPKLLCVTRKSLPIIVLGSIRVILVKGTDYPVLYSFDLFFFFKLAKSCC